MHAAHLQWITEHMRLAAVLQTLKQLAAQGIARPDTDELRAARAILVYLADYPHRVHHRREETELFPRLRGREPDIDRLLDRLAAEHAASGEAVLRLMHALNRAEFGGAAERERYAGEAARFVADWHAHMQAEEHGLFPAAERLLGEADWQAVASELARDRDPLHGLPAEAPFDELLKQIVRIAPV